MIQKVVVLPEIAIEHLVEGKLKKPTKPWAWISITETPDHTIATAKNQVALSPNLRAVLPLYFGDISDTTFKQFNEQDKKRCPLFEEFHAKEIMGFVKMVKDEVETLVVNCAAGISRSAAVGEWATLFLDLDYDDFRKRNPHILPNAYVLSILKRVSGMTP